MNSTDAVLTALKDADGVIDKMELATDVFGANEITRLGAYQSSAATGTTDQEDLEFLRMFQKYIVEKSGKRG